MDALGVRHEGRECFLGGSLFLLEDVERRLRFVALLVEVSELRKLLLDLSFLVGLLFLGFVGKTEILPGVRGVVIEFEHTRADDFRAGLAAFGSAHEAIDDFLVLVEQGLVGTGDAVGCEIAVIVAVGAVGIFRIDVRHGVVHVGEDVNSVVFFDLIDSDLRQRVGI